MTPEQEKEINIQTVALCLLYKKDVNKSRIVLEVDDIINLINNK